MPTGSSANTTDAIRVNDEFGSHSIELSADGGAIFNMQETFSEVVVRSQASGSLLEIGASAVGFFGKTPAAQPSVTGALSTVIDPAAKAVLTSLLADLVTLGLASNGTT